ncbi:MAG: glycerate kinase [Blastocatellia bacterium]
MTDLTVLRHLAQSIFRRTLAAIDAETVVRAALRRSGDTLTAGQTPYDLTRVSRLLVIAIGKAAATMTRGAIDALDTHISEGLMVTNAFDGAPPPGFRVMLGGHPLPNAQSVAAAGAALEMLRAADGDDTLVLFLISGGGSALFEKPIDDSLTLEDLREVNRVLVGCGAVIGEMNVVRKYLSAVKGGRLAEAAPRARQVSLYISDVNSDDLATIASGPTIASRATVAELQRIVARFDLLNAFPARAADVLRRALAHTQAEQPPNAGAHHLLLDNEIALARAADIAREMGCAVEIAHDLVEGDVQEMAVAHLDHLADLGARHPGKTVCLLSGGEVICPVRGTGRGGRNQEFVLRAAIAMEQRGLTGTVVLSAGTDGIDGHSPAAGAIAGADTIARAHRQNLSAGALLDNSDSFTFFGALDDALITGPTGNNVRDLRILLANASSANSSMKNPPD